MNLPVQFRLYSPSQPEISSSLFSAQIDDLSEQGMCLQTDSISYDNLHILQPSISTSEQCQLEIKIIDDDNALTVHGKAVWYDRNTNGGKFVFRAGIEFLHLTRDLKKQLNLLINEKEKQKPRSAA